MDLDTAATWDLATDSVGHRLQKLLRRLREVVKANCEHLADCHRLSRRH